MCRRRRRRRHRRRRATQHFSFWRRWKPTHKPVFFISLRFFRCYIVVVVPFFMSTSMYARINWSRSFLHKTLCRRYRMPCYFCHSFNCSGVFDVCIFLLLLLSFSFRSHRALWPSMWWHHLSCSAGGAEAKNHSDVCRWPNGVDKSK